MAQIVQVTAFNCFYFIKPQTTPVWPLLVTLALFSPRLCLIGLSGCSSSKGNFPLIAEKKYTKRQRKNNLKQTQKIYDCLKDKPKILEVSSDIFSICPIKCPLIFE